MYSTILWRSATAPGPRPVAHAQHTQPRPRLCSVMAQPERLPSPDTQDRQAMYERALELSRSEMYDDARQAFHELLQAHPGWCRGYVSWAQMERRVARTYDPERLAVARSILQRGLQANPFSGCLAQAWGLMELQRGNDWAAVRLLERSVLLEPELQPVLKWKPVSAARRSVMAAALGRGSRRSSGGAAPRAPSCAMCTGGPCLALRGGRCAAAGAGASPSGGGGGGGAGSGGTSAMSSL